MPTAALLRRYLGPSPLVLLVLLVACASPSAPGPLDDGPPPRVASGPFIVAALPHPSLAALEDREGHLVVVPRAWIPERAREGDVVVGVFGDGTPRMSAGRPLLRVDAAATDARRRAIRERYGRLARAPPYNLRLWSSPGSVRRRGR